MMRRQVIQVDPDAPSWSKVHIKQENVWGKQYDREREKVDLTQYPAAGEEIIAWQEGIVIAQEKARTMGILAEDDDVRVYVHPGVAGNEEVLLMASDSDLLRSETANEHTEPCDTEVQSNMES